MKEMTLEEGFEKLEKENQAWRDSRDGIMAENEALALRAINLACCGNCIHLEKDYEDLICAYTESTAYFNEYCPHWTTDGINRDQRTRVNKHNQTPPKRG